MDRRVYSRSKVSSLRSTARWCWVITWKSFLQRLVGDKTCPFLHPDNGPRAVEVTCQ